MSPNDADLGRAWQRYLAAKRLRLDPEECQRLFDAYFKLERADSIAHCQAEADRAKRESARRLSVSGSEKAKR